MTSSASILIYWYTWQTIEMRIFGLLGWIIFWSPARRPVRGLCDRTTRNSNILWRVI